MPAVYDKFAGNYDRAFAPLEWLGLSRWRQEVSDLLPLDADILEIGCGAGANFEFYPRCNRAVSSEISTGMLQVAAGKRRENHLIQADAQSLPFGNDEFDAAFATLVFCSIPDPTLAFKELRRVIKPGGRIILLEHVRPDGILGPVFDVLNRITVLAADDHFNRETAKIAADSGLTVTEVRKKLGSIVNLIICEV
ncbi:MAG: class I SAM-dependent methyltransferase [bacterium]|nr:class I SAM-dependent methyltransferase [bacterium]